VALLAYPAYPHFSPAGIAAHFSVKQFANGYGGLPKAAAAPGGLLYLFVQLNHLETPF
jgi:hypothetical protein